jgi:hypothetical protein
MSGRKAPKSVSGKDKEGDGKRQGQIGIGGGGGGGTSSRVSVLVFPKLQDYDGNVEAGKETNSDIVQVIWGLAVTV